MIKFLKNILSTGFLCIAGFAFAAEPENILMIEVQGSANGIIEIELLPQKSNNRVISSEFKYQNNQSLFRRTLIKVFNFYKPALT